MAGKGHDDRRVCLCDRADGTCAGLAVQRHRAGGEAACVEQVREDVGVLRPRERPRLVLRHRRADAIQERFEVLALPVRVEGRACERGRSLLPAQRVAVALAAAFGVELFAARRLLLGVNPVPDGACRLRDQPRAGNQAEDSENPAIHSAAILPKVG